MATVSDFLGGDTIANAGNILGQGMARRGGLLGLPLGALIGGASQNALQQRQQKIQSTLANQIRSYAAQSKDPAEQAQLHMAADMAGAGMDPSSLLRISKTANGGAKTLTELWQQDPESAKALAAILHPPKPVDTGPKNEFQLYQQNPGAAMAYARMMHPIEPKDTTPKSVVELFQQNPAKAKALLEMEAALHPGSNAEMPINPNDIGTDPTTGKKVIALRDKAGNSKIVPVPDNYVPPAKKGPAAKLPTRGTTKINGYNYQTLKRPDGSMIASFSDTPGLSAMLAPYGLGKKIHKTYYYKPGSAKGVPLPDGVPPEAVEPAP